jgi:hypothetical protein
MLAKTGSRNVVWSPSVDTLLRFALYFFLSFVLTDVFLFMLPWVGLNLCLMCFACSADLPRGHDPVWWLKSYNSNSLEYSTLRS